MKKKKLSINRYTTTAGLFIACIVFFFFANFTTSSIVIGKKIVASKELTVNSLIDSIESGYTEGFFAKLNFVDIYGGVQKLMNKNVVGDFDVIRDDQGRLHLGIDNYKITSFNSDLILEFQKAAGNIPILYLHTGNKILENYTTFETGLISNKVENSKFIINYVRDLGVDVIDLQATFQQEHADYSKLFYITDHHWRIETAFNTYKNLLQIFEDDYSLTFPNKNQIIDDNNFEFIQYEDFFLGSSGKRVGRWYAGMDDFTLILPRFDTNYTAYDYNRFQEPLDGSFRDVIISEERLSDPAIDTNRYTSYLYGDYAKRKFVNHDGKNNILIIEDSYGLPLSSFLSLAFNELTIIDFRLFKDSISTLIEEGDFDVILFVNQIQYP
ncbi:MAG: hypothetical protein K0R15_971 [Clostridiales bacterium]|jgi:hypothetical protein|nr:hypothetical protein [Clostridiales bacterium]